MREDVLVLYSTTPTQMARLRRRFTLHETADAPDSVRGIVVNGNTPISRDLLNRLPSLEVICSSASGHERIDLDALAERGIRLTNTSIALANEVADAAMLLLLAARRSLIGAHRHVQSGDWARGSYPLQSSIGGKRLGIVGFGAIGQAILTRAKAFGMQIAYHARHDRDIAVPFYPDLEALADWADNLVLCVPGGNATRGMIDARILRALGPKGTLVNVARGSVVNEEDLIAALSQGWIASAGLDVFATEPQVDPRLTALPNVTMMPHHASGTVETREAMARLMVDNLIAHFDGRPLLSQVPLR